MNGEVAKHWYSKSKVKTIFSPDLSSWRSRYDLKDQLLLRNDKLVIRNMRKSDLISPTNSTDMEHQVEPKEAFRPDIIAYNVYGDPRLAWVILSFNNMKDVFELKAGMRIIIPSATTIYMNGGVMSR